MQRRCGGGSVRPARRGARARAWAISIGIVIALAVPAGVAYALFSDSAAKAGGVIVAGNLQLAPDATSGSAVSWVETTPNVPVGQRRSGTSFATLAQFRGVPGDSVDVRYAVTSTLAGDNSSAVSRAALTTPSQPLPSGLSASGYRVLDSTGVLLAPASGVTPLGTSTRLASLTSGGQQKLIIAVRMAWTGTAGSLTYTTEVTTPGTPTLTTIPVTITLEQVRDGAGFVP